MRYMKEIEQDEKGAPMNLKKLKLAEEAFFRQYPDGFNDPEMIAIGKKHKMTQFIEFAQESFGLDAFDNIEEMTENMIKMVQKSTMVSLFEKPKFRDSVRSMTQEEKTRLVLGLREMLHGNEAEGFDMMLSVLDDYKLAKWTLITVFSCYYRPTEDLLFKPTTVKNVINYFELEGLHYKPKPSYDFFVKYRHAINEMKTHVDPSLAPNNATFSGFLMISMENRQ